MENEYKEYLMADDLVKARKSAGGLFYEVLLSGGGHLRIRTAVFESVSVEVKDGDKSNRP